MRVGLSMVAVMVLAGCGSAELAVDEGEASDTLFSAESTVIVGTVNWKSTTLLSATSAEAKNARAVGYLSIPAKGTRCTAWLIANDKVVTNHHCISSATQAVGAKVSFDYVDGVTSSKRAWYDCSKFIRAWSDVDASVLQCAPRDGKLPGTVYGTIPLATGNVSTGAGIYVLHQNCDYYSGSCAPTKKYSPGTVTSSSWWSTGIKYDADTLGGSSGSPVFARTGTHAHKLVALHHLGFNGDENGRGTANGGMKVTALKSRLAEVGL